MLHKYQITCDAASLYQWTLGSLTTSMPFADYSYSKEHIEIANPIKYVSDIPESSKARNMKTNNTLAPIQYSIEFLLHSAATMKVNYNTTSIAHEP